MKKLAITIFAILGISLINSAQADSAKLINPENGHSYKRFDSAKTWSKSKAYCIQQGGYLATITTQSEQDWIVSEGLDSSDTWIGGSDATIEGTWTWVTGESFSYVNWAVGEPNDHNGQDYLSFSNYSVFPRGTWDDRGLPGGDSSQAYLCEWNQLKIYSQVNTLPDINGNGSQELALVGELGSNYMLFIYDSETQAIIKETIVKPIAGNLLKSLTIVDDISGNGKPEIAVLITKKSINSTVLQLHDSLTGTVVKTITLPNS